MEPASQLHLRGVIALAASGNVRNRNSGILRISHQQLRSRNLRAVDAGGWKQSGERVIHLRIKVRRTVGDRKAVQQIRGNKIQRQRYGQLVSQVADIGSVGEKTPRQLALQTEGELMRTWQRPVEILRAYRLSEIGCQPLARTDWLQQARRI